MLSPELDINATYLREDAEYSAVCQQLFANCLIIKTAILNHHRRDANSSEAPFQLHHATQAAAKYG